MNKLILATLITATLPVVAEEYVVRIPALDLASSSSVLPLEYGDWRDIGDVFSCSIPLPLVSSINFGESFIQKETCSQNREREVTKKVKDEFSGVITVESITIEPGSYKKELTSSAIGTKNYEVSEELGEWSEYVGTGNYTNCDVDEKYEDSHYGAAYYDTLSLKFVSKSGYIYKYAKTCDENAISTQHVYSIMADGSKIKKSSNTKNRIDRGESIDDYDARQGIYSKYDTYVRYYRRKSGSGKTYFYAEVNINRKEVYETSRHSLKSNMEAELLSAGYKMGGVLYEERSSGISDNQYYYAMVEAPK